MNRRLLHKLAAGSLATLGAGTILPQTRAQLVNKLAEQLENGEFNWFPERAPGPGPLLIIVSIPDQLLHVYRSGIRVAASTVSTGKPGHSTPTGVFKILQKDRNHHSATYNNAPMPNMNRLTWSGIALHAGQLPGFPASHGCVRLPLEFSALLFGITTVGMTVVIADNKSQPASVVHPGMVLGEYARHEFLGVSTAMKKAQYSAGQSESLSSTSIVVSGKDRQMTVWENDGIVATGEVEIDDETRPLPESVHTLVAADSSRSHIRWTSASYGKSDREDLAAELRRIKAEPAVREAARQRMHHGMTLVTTSGTSTAAHRTTRDFVVLDGIY